MNGMQFQNAGLTASNDNICFEAWREGDVYHVHYKTEEKTFTDFLQAKAYIDDIGAQL